MALKPVEGKHEDSSDLFFWDDVLSDEGPESIFDFSSELKEEARHARDKCMSCDKSPTIDVLWAEGIGHAWFCAKCYTAWEKEHPGEVNNTKKIEHGIARMKFSDRNSPESLREAGRRVRATRVKQVKNIIQAWQKLRAELDDWLKWAEYMDGDWVEAPNIHGEPVKEEMIAGWWVSISGTNVFIQEKAQFASRDREWDASAAEKRIRAWADAEDGPNAKYGRAFLYHDSDIEGFGGYKLPFADIENGEFKVVPRAIFAVAGAIAGARGGIDVPEKDKQAIRKRVEGYYAKMRKEFDDESIGKE